MALEGKSFSHYRILKLIGKGGMGEVYLIEDIQVQRQVAAKVLRIETVPSVQENVTSALRLFRREAMVIAGLDHPHILPLYDYGEATVDEFHFAYLILPYRPERSLATWMRNLAQTQQTHLLTCKQVMHVIQQAARALQYAHDHQIMHLDIKPANFLVRSRQASDDYPDLQLSDFGIAHLVSATSSSNQHMRGTPIYMAPEQWANQPTFASDQYALAIMAYELLTGRPPFQGQPMNLMFAHLQKQPISICDRNALLPPAVNLVVQRALAKMPEERFPSVAEFARALQEALEGSSDKHAGTVETPSPIPLAVKEVVSSLSHTQPAQPFPLVPTLPLTQKIAMRSSTASHHLLVSPQDPVPLPPMASIPAVLSPQRSASSQLQRRRLPLIIAVVILFILVLLAGASMGISRVITDQPSNPGAGKIWHEQHSGLISPLRGVVWGVAQFVVVGSNGIILSSPDGRSWTTQLSTSNMLLGMTWGDSQFVVVGSNGIILTSPDGRSWTIQPSSTTDTLWGVTWGDSQFVAVGDNGAEGTILTSPDGRSWTTQRSTPDILKSVMWGDSQFVAVGHNGAILTSPDGHSWTTHRVSTPDILLNVTWGDSQFVAVGNNGAEGIILTSPDGHSWTTQRSTTDSLQSVTWGDSQFVAVGNNGAEGTILTSPDGRSWTIQRSTTDSLQSVTWGDSQFVAVEHNGAILTSS